MQAELTAAAASADTEENLGAYIWSESGADLGSLLKRQQQQQQQQQQLQQQLPGGEALAMKCK
jgi:hypothetical protein